MSAVSAERLLDRIARSKPVPLIVLLGTDLYLREMCRSKIIEAYVPPEARDWAVTRLSAREDGWDEVLARAETMPMMASHQVVIAESAESIEKLGEKSREDVVRALEEYLKSPAPFTILTIEATGLDGRQRFAKLLNEYKEGLVVELSIGAESAPLLAAQMAKDLGAEIDRDAAALLADMLDGSPARMRVELEKLASYVRGNPIATADVELLVVAARKNTVFQLADMLASRRRGDALAFLDNLMREGEEPAGMIGALAWMYRKLIEARDLPAHTPGYQAARHLGMRSDSADFVMRQAHRFAKADLLAGLVALAEADSELKSSNANPRASLEFLIVRLTSTAARAAVRSA